MKFIDEYWSDKTLPPSPDFLGLLVSLEPVGVHEVQ
jgi:hypothetical protein